MIAKLLPDPRTRVTIYGVGYNLGAAVFGGTATLIGSSFVSSAIEGFNIIYRSNPLDLSHCLFKKYLFFLVSQNLASRITMNNYLYFLTRLSLITPLQFIP